LIPVSPEIAEVELSDPARFPDMLDARVPTSWPPEILSDARPLFRDLLREDPSRTGWIGWYAILVTEGERVLVGSAGFTGPPDAGGTVETGYSMLPEYQGRGFATEMVRALCAWAFVQPHVTTVVAETTWSNAASMNVLEKCGFNRVEPLAGAPEEPVHYRRTRVEVD
jgi:[ribosomal protein S5]-alanine N-acetyltransferase